MHVRTEIVSITICSQLIAFSFTLTAPELAIGQSTGGAACVDGEQGSEQARALYIQGKESLRDRDYQGAVQHFASAYACWSKPALLFTLAEAEHKAGHALAAYCHYRQYLGEDHENAGFRAKAWKRLPGLLSVLENDLSIRWREGQPVCTPGESRATNLAITVNLEIVDARHLLPPPERQQSPLPSTPDSRGPLFATVSAGPSVLDMGNLDIDGAQFTSDLTVGYAIDLGRLGVDLGARASYTPVPWNNGTGASGMSSFIGVLASLGVRVGLGRSFAVRASLSGGGLLLAGLAEGNVFMADTRSVHGPLVLPSARASLGLEYAITPGLLISLVPATFSYTRARHRLRAGIDDVTRLGMTLGLGWRM